MSKRSIETDNTVIVEEYVNVSNDSIWYIYAKDSVKYFVVHMKNYRTIYCSFNNFFNYSVESLTAIRNFIIETTSQKPSISIHRKNVPLLTIARKSGFRKKLGASHGYITFV